MKASQTYFLNLIEFMLRCTMISYLITRGFFLVYGEVVILTFLQFLRSHFTSKAFFRNELS